MYQISVIVNEKPLESLGFNVAGILDLHDIRTQVWPKMLQHKQIKTSRENIYGLYLSLFQKCSLHCFQSMILSKEFKHLGNS